MPDPANLRIGRRKLENLCLVICNLVYPGRIDWLVRFAHLLTKVKFGLLPIGLIFLTIIVVMWFIRKIDLRVTLQVYRQQIFGE